MNNAQQNHIPLDNNPTLTSGNLLRFRKNLIDRTTYKI